MKVLIDQDGCIECGACAGDCPDVFMMDDNGKAAIVDKFQADEPSQGEVKDNFRSCAEDAAENCPVDVITVD